MTNQAFLGRSHVEHESASAGENASTVPLGSLRPISLPFGNTNGKSGLSDARPMTVGAVERIVPMRQRRIA